MQTQKSQMHGSLPGSGHLTNHAAPAKEASPVADTSQTSMQLQQMLPLSMSRRPTSQRSHSSVFLMYWALQLFIPLRSRFKARLVACASERSSALPTIVLSRICSMWALKVLNLSLCSLARGGYFFGVRLLHNLDLSFVELA